MQNPFSFLNRQTVRAPSNPLDKCTVISIYPRDIHEEKCTIQPGIFDIKAGSYEKPSTLIVGPSSWWKELDESQPLLEIPQSSIQIADSIVRDYTNGLLACNMGDCIPGLFYVPGEHSVEVIKKLSNMGGFKHLLDIAQVKQRNWFFALVKIADVLWSRTNGNPLSISDDMRLAAKELDLHTKEWLKDFQHIEMVRCVACGALRNPVFPVCQTCHAVADKEKAKELNLTFAV